MAGAKIALSNTSGELKTDGNDNAAVNLPLTEADAGYAAVTYEQDAGTVTGSTLRKVPEVTEDFRVRVGMDSVMLAHRFVGTALNSAIWTSPNSTLTITVAGGYVNLNAGLSTATSSHAPRPPPLQRSTSLASRSTVSGANPSALPTSRTALRPR